MFIALQMLKKDYIQRSLDLIFCSTDRWISNAAYTTDSVAFQYGGIQKKNKL